MKEEFKIEPKFTLVAPLSHLISPIVSLKSEKCLNLSIEKFDLKLKLKEPLKYPLCKGKYFRFEVCLINRSAFPVPKAEKFKLEANIFTFQKPHQKILKNLSGNDILAGTTHSELVFQESTNLFQANFKLKINEVSSRYSGINLIVQTVNNDFIDKTGMLVKPLIIKNLMIKSKEKTCQKFREYYRANNFVDG